MTICNNTVTIRKARAGTKFKQCEIISINSRRKAVRFNKKLPCAIVWKNYHRTIAVVLQGAIIPIETSATVYAGEPVALTNDGRVKPARWAI